MMDSFPPRKVPFHFVLFSQREVHANIWDDSVFATGADWQFIDGRFFFHAPTATILTRK